MEKLTFAAQIASSVTTIAAAVAGETVNEDYSMILQYRKEAREEINRLQENLE